jgi:pimeloyl-ACP methyl ester carboxylesterase
VTDTDITLQDVVLRPGVTVDLNARVYVDESRPASSCGPNQTAVAVNGFAHTAATWEDFAEAMFDAHPQTVCRLVALDLPGHGGSGLPEGGLPFAFLTLDDYASALLGALDALPAYGIEARSVIAHSQGGMVVQLAQQRLVDAGSSLRASHDIHDVVLISPTMPNGLSWAFAENGTAGLLLSNFLVADDPVLGPHFVIPDALLSVVFFSNLSGQVASGAPDGAEVAARGFNGPEPLLSALQLVGAAPFGQRPAIDAGIFGGGSGSQLTIIALEQDQVIRPAEASALYAYLVGRPGGGNRFITVTGAEAVHSMYVSDPEGMVEAIGPAVP